MTDWYARAPTDTPAGSDANGGTGWGDAFATPQKGIDSLVSGGADWAAGDNLYLRYSGGYVYPGQSTVRTPSNASIIAVDDAGNPATLDGATYNPAWDSSQIVQIDASAGAGTYGLFMAFRMSLWGIEIVNSTSAAFNTTNQAARLYRCKAGSSNAGDGINGIGDTGVPGTRVWDCLIDGVGDKGIDPSGQEDCDIRRTIVRNTGDAGIDAAGVTTMEHVTVDGCNQLNGTYQVLMTTGSTILNSSVTNGAAGGVSGAAGAATYTNAYGNAASNFGASVAGAGCTEVDPLYVDQAAGDFHLTASSPLIGAGSNSASSTEDYDGVSFEDPPAMGAFEFVPDPVESVELLGTLELVFGFDGSLPDDSTFQVYPAESDTLRGLVLNSLLTDRRARDDDALPTADGYKGGWWADAYDEGGDSMGSHLWLLSRAKVTDETPRDVEDYAAEALEWLVDDGIAGDVEVEAERLGNDTIALVVTIERGDDTETHRFDDLWGIFNG